MNVITSSSAVVEMPHNALCPSVVSFNSVMPQVQSFIIVTSASDLPLRTLKCSSVVFSVTLTGFATYTSSSSRVKNKPRHLPATGVNNLPGSSQLSVLHLENHSQHAMEADIR